MIKLKKLRTEKKLSQKDIAEYLGITQQAYANYERQARQADYDTLKKLSNFFDVSVDYLLGQTDAPQTLSLDEQMEGIEFALYGEMKDLTDEQKQEILDYVRFKKQQKK